MEIKQIELKMPDCIKDETITPMTRDEARTYYQKLWRYCPDFHELPIPAFFLEENEKIQIERDQKPGFAKYLRETTEFYESIQHLSDEEKLEKIRERNADMIPLRKKKPLGNLLF